MAKLTFRLVPDQRPEKIMEVVRAHVLKHTPAGVTVEIEVGHSGNPYLVDAHSPAGEAAQRALRATFPGVEPALIREGGTDPDRAGRSRMSWAWRPFCSDSHFRTARCIRRMRIFRWRIIRPARGSTAICSGELAKGV